MNTCKNAHYKSAIQFFNTTDQAVPVTALAVNPVSLLLGTKVTDTGVAMDYGTNSVYVETSGLYRVSADIGLLGVTGGNITIAMTVNGEILPETVRIITVVAGIEEAVPIETVRRFHTCCGNEEYVIGLIAYSDGTGVATVDRLSGNAIKLA